jgi:hypothetical protein
VEVFDPASTRGFLAVTDCWQSRAEQSRSLLLAISRHGHSWHRAPVGPVAIYLLDVKTFVFFFPSLILLNDKEEGVGLFFLFFFFFFFFFFFSVFPYYTYFCVCFYAGILYLTINISVSIAKFTINLPLSFVLSCYIFWLPV